MATYEVKRWETSMQRDVEMAYHRTNIWVVQSSIADDDPKQIINAVFGTTEPGKLAWVWQTSEGVVSDTEVVVENIDVRLRNRDESRFIWIVRTTYVDIRAMKPIGRSRNSPRQSFPQ